MEIYTSHNSHYLCYDYLIVKQITPKLSGVKQPFIMIMDFACQKFGLDTRMPSFSVPESWGFKWKTPKAEEEIIQICCVYAREKEREKRETGNCHESFKTWTQSYTVSLLPSFLYHKVIKVYTESREGEVDSKSL